MENAHADTMARPLSCEDAVRIDGSVAAGGASVMDVSEPTIGEANTKALEPCSGRSRAWIGRPFVILDFKEKQILILKNSSRLDVRGQTAARKIVHGPGFFDGYQLSRQTDL